MREDYAEVSFPYDMSATKEREQLFILKPFLHPFTRKSMLKLFLKQIGKIHQRFAPREKEL